MSIIAVRRSLAGQVVFFDQRKNHVYYSHDRVTWHYGWTIPPTTTSAGGHTYYDLSKGDEIFKEYNNSYHQTTNFKTIINNIKIETSRTNALYNLGNTAESAFDPKRLCLAIKAFLQVTRDMSLAVANGQVEGDDIEAMADAANDLIPIAGSYIATIINWGAPEILAYGQITDQQLEDIQCCIYDQLKDGDFNYAEFLNLGTVCNFAAWDEIASPEMYSLLITMMIHDRLEGECTCEDCFYIAGADAEVIQGKPVGKALISASVNTGGNVNEMQARGRFYFPSMTVQSVTVFYISVPYENTAAATPIMRFTAPNTGGGSTALAGGNVISSVAVPANQLPLTNGITYVDINIASSTCASCTAAQLATYNESYGGILFVYVCGILD